MSKQPVAAHESFKFLTRQYVPSLQIEVQSFEHIITGARHYHIVADYDENVFFVALRTMPQDSTGVAHILEHTTLCGSERYPVRDPFFMMIRRSLNTFMNAFTSSDWTAYPFASQNRKDFFNLLDVYLDAVFFSRLDPLDFAQEGHRLEFEKGEDSSTPLQYKGVVFNEMKGAMSSVNSQIYQELYRHLYPTTTYHHNSGGTPSHIPDLTYEQLLAFYKTHYHPSNATFMTFGTYAAQELQAVFHEKALKKFEKLNKSFYVPPEKRYYSPISIESAYGLDEENLEKKTYHSLAWLLGDCTDVYAQLEGEFLSELLLGSSASPLRQALETSTLGTGPSPICGTDTSPREMSFLVGLQGSDPQHAGAFEDLVLTLLHSLAEKGIDKSLVDAAVHQLEISQREISSGGYPFGLSVIMSAISVAIHHGDPVDALNVDPHLEKLRERTADPQYVKDMIRRLLLDNPHRVRLTLKPDAHVNQRMKQQEQEKLASIESALSDEEKKELVKKAAALAKRQAHQDDPTILPKVTREDVPVEVKHPKKFKHSHQVPLNYYEAGTNGIVYLTRMIDLSGLLATHTKSLIPFTSWLTKLGYDALSYLEVQQLLSATTGGIGTTLSESPLTDGTQQISAALTYTGKALARNLEPLIQSMNNFLYKPRFDEIQRIKEITGLAAARKEQSIPSAGHQLASLAAGAALFPSGTFNHQFGGLAAVQYWKALHESAQNDGELFNQTIEHCQQLAKLLAEQPTSLLFISEKDAIKDQLNTIKKLCQDHRGFETCQILPWDTQGVGRHTYWITNTQVNFVATANMTVPYMHPDSPALRILAALLSHKYLHTAIREKGGAYGGGAKFGAISGCFSFYSYRDPRMEETLDDFAKAIEWVQSAPITEQELEEAILTVISAIDKRQTPANEAASEFFQEFHGLPAETRDRYRASLLNVTIADIKRVAATWLSTQDRAVAIIGPGSNRDKAESMGLTIEVI